MLYVEQRDFPLLMVEWSCGECLRWYLELPGYDLALCQRCGKVMTDNGEVYIKSIKPVEPAAAAKVEDNVEDTP